MITKLNFRPLPSVITDDSVTIQDAALSVEDIVKGAQSGMIDLDTIRLPASDISDDVVTVDEDLPIIDDIAVASEYVDAVNDAKNTHNSTSNTDNSTNTDNTSSSVLHKDVTNDAPDVDNVDVTQ